MFAERYTCIQKMRKPIVENVEKWTDHYKSMAEGKFPLEDVYVLNQIGRGLGNSRRGKMIYKIKNPNKTITSIPIISPVAQGINQAESMVKKKGKGIKRSSKKKSSHLKRNNCRRQKKTKRKTKQKRKTTIRKKKKRDIFG